MQIQLLTKTQQQDDMQQFQAEQDKNSPNQISSQNCTKQIRSRWQRPMDFRRRERCVEKPTNFHVTVVLLQAFWKEHEMVVMTPHNISILIVFVYHISKHLISLNICSKLRLETSGGGQAVFLRKSKVMKKRPQDVVAIPIIVLMNDVFIKEYRNTPLQEMPKTLVGPSTQHIYHIQLNIDVTNRIIKLTISELCNYAHEQIKSQNDFGEEKLSTFSAKALVSAFCPISSGTFTPAHPIHLASNSFTPSNNLSKVQYGDSFQMNTTQKKVKKSKTLKNLNYLHILIKTKWDETKQGFNETNTQNATLKTTYQEGH